MPCSRPGTLRLTEMESDGEVHLLRRNIAPLPSNPDPQPPISMLCAGSSKSGHRKTQEKKYNAEGVMQGASHNRLESCGSGPMRFFETPDFHASEVQTPGKPKRKTAMQISTPASAARHRKRMSYEPSLHLCFDRDSGLSTSSH